MNALKAIPVLLAMAVVSACETLTVPDFNNPDIEELTGIDPTEIAVITAAQGLFIRARSGIAGRAGYVSELGIIGRESYNFDAADPRFVTELLRDALDGGNGAFGGNHWAPRYRGFRDADNVLNAVEMLAMMDAADKEGLRGFTKTFQALDLLLVINTRDDLGAVITVAEDPTSDPEPIVDRAAVFARIAALLDEAQGHLGGATFPSSMRFPSGFTGFDTPATFLTFNRALKARVDVYMGNTALALSSSLPASFLDETGAFGLGVYYNYGTGSGDLVNNLFDPSNLIILAHPSIETDAQTQTDGMTLDQRFVDKTISVATVTDQGGLG
ncbi:MAG: RagB/SusD family nutrient uptake outer membrane protein, partial [Gemmatimonadales bacterium]